MGIINHWKWTIIYVLVHILTYTAIKAYLKNLIEKQKSMDNRRKFAPFMRKDLHLLDLTQSLWWLTAWPRLIFYFSWVLFWFTIF